MKKYYDESSAPLRFYRFLKVVSVISAILSIFTTFFWLMPWIDVSGFYTLPLFWIDTFFRLSFLITLFMAAFELPRMNWRGVLAYGAYLFLISAYMAFTKIVSSYNSTDVLYTLLVHFIAGLVYLVPYCIYFAKRRPLFTPYSIKLNTTAEPPQAVPLSTELKREETPPTEEKNEQPSQAKEKSGAFRRYDTYIVCPACGSMVSKGTKHCDCGFDFRNPVARFFGNSKKHKLPLALSAIIVVLAVCLLTASIKLQTANRVIENFKQENQVLNAKVESLTQDNREANGKVSRMEEDILEAVDSYYELLDLRDDCLLCKNYNFPSLTLPYTTIEIAKSNDSSLRIVRVDGKGALERMQEAANK